jgi:transcriptional regulator with XRE-family HTH domain
MEVHESSVGIGRRIKELRRRRGITAQGLADLVSATGVRCDRWTVTKLETGRRQNVTVVELLAFARVLEVAPVNLLISPTNEGTFPVTPAECVDLREARAWFRGVKPLPNTDLRIFHTEVPLNELGQS